MRNAKISKLKLEYKKVKNKKQKLFESTINKIEFLVKNSNKGK